MDPSIQETLAQKGYYYDKEMDRILVNSEKGIISIDKQTIKEYIMRKEKGLILARSEEEMLPTEIHEKFIEKMGIKTIENLDSSMISCKW